MEMSDEKLKAHVAQAAKETAEMWGMSDSFIHVAHVNNLFTGHTLIPTAELEDLRRYVDVVDKLLATRDELLTAVPECEAHGNQCVPHAIEWVKTAAAELEALRARVKELETEQGECARYATRLAVSLAKRHPNGGVFEPWPHVLGLLTQIDNITVGLRDRVDQLEALVAEVLPIMLRYTKDVPLGHQPHMLAHRATDWLSKAGHTTPKQ